MGCGPLLSCQCCKFSESLVRKPCSRPLPGKVANSTCLVWFEGCTSQARFLEPPCGSENPYLRLEKTTWYPSKTAKCPPLCPKHVSFLHVPWSSLNQKPQTATCDPVVKELESKLPFSGHSPSISFVVADPVLTVRSMPVSLTTNTFPKVLRCDAGDGSGQHLPVVRALGEIKNCNTNWRCSWGS